MIRELLRGTIEFPRTRTGSPDLRAVPDGLGASPRRWLDAPPGPYTIERADAYCETFARAHHEAFPVASRFVPTELRPHLLSVYAFARAADDFADEPEYEGHRIEALDAWEQHLNRCLHGEASHPVFVALARTIEARDLSTPPFEQLLSAFRSDVEITRYPTFARLRGYTSHAAEPVGRLLLALFGYRDPTLIQYADEISTALQLTNFWQDVAADAARDHIYLPGEDLHYFGVTEADVKALRPTEPLRDLIRYQVARTRAIYQHGRPLLRNVGKDLRLELTIIWLLGMAILDKIEAADYDVFTKRPVIRKRDRALVLARAARQWAMDLDLSSLRHLWGI
jgi:hydroxysqualene synthase